MSLPRQSTRITRNQRTFDPIVASSNPAQQQPQQHHSSSNSPSATSNAPRSSFDNSNQMASRSTSTRTPHRVTVRKTAYQVSRLQEMWAVTTTPTKEQREQIAEEIGLDTRIVSTWFRDERSKLTRQRAEQQRTERAAIGPIRSTRMSSSTAPAASASSATAVVNSTVSRNRHASVDALSEMDEQDDILVDQQTLDRHDRASASPSAQPPSNGNTVLVQPSSMHSPRSASTTTTRASPYHSHSHNSDVKWNNKSPRYSPYPLSTSPDSRTMSSTMSTGGGRQYEPVLRASAPIDIHRSHHQYRNHPSQYQYAHHQPTMAHHPQSQVAHHRPIAPQHRHHLSTETDADSIGYLSPGYPHRSVPAPSVSSSSETSDEDELEEDELIEQDQEDDLDDDEDGVRFNQVGSYSPRTPAYLTSSLPSPRVMHAPSTSIPKSSNATGLTLPPISSLGVGFGGSPLLPPTSKKHHHHHHHQHHHQSKSMSISPFRNPITLPTETGGTYTVEPLPVIVGPQPNRDSTWRWKYYDKVSSMRHTLSDRLFHSDPAKVSSSSSSIARTAPQPTTTTTTTTVTNHGLARGESDDEDVPFSDGPSPIPSPRVRNSVGLPALHQDRGVLERIGIFGGGKKQFFATPAKYSDYTSALSSTTAHDAL